MKKFYYFVRYTLNGIPGMCECALNHRITDWSHILELVEIIQIQCKSHGPCIIDFYQLLREKIDKN